MRKILTQKQAMFVQEYLVDLNATQAAIRAGYSEKTAYCIGDENLRKPNIAKAIQEAMDERGKRLEITQDTVMRNIEELRKKAEKEKQFSVSARCLELQGKHLSMFTDNSKEGTQVQVIISRGGVVLKSGNDTLGIEDASPD